MITRFVCILIFLLPFFSDAQSSQHLYSGGFGNKIISTSDGGFIITGEIQNTSYTRCFMMKYNSSLFPVWLKTYYDLLEFYSYGMDIKEIPGEGFLFTRAMYHDTISNFQISLVKIDSLGQRIWSKSYGSTVYDDLAQSIAITNNGYYLGAYTSGYGAGGEDFTLIKTDTSGNILWSKIYGTSRDEHGMIVLPYHGGFVFGGYCQTASSGYDLALVFTDTAGTITSVKQLSAAGDQILSSMIVTADGGLLLAASSGTGFSNVHSLYLKISSGGQISWSKMLPDYYSVPSDVIETQNGFISSGKIYHQQFHENSYIFQIDSTGSITSQDYFGDSTGCEIISSAILNSDVITTGSYVKSSDQTQCIYFSNYLLNDTACNHYVENFSLQPFTLTISSPVWQTSSATIPQSNSVMAVNDPLMTDSNVCDFTPSTQDFYFDNNFSVYPNPAHDKLTVSCSEKISGATITICNFTGAIVSSAKILNQNSSIDISDLQAGIYSVEIKTNKGRSLRKLIVE